MDRSTSPDGSSAYLESLMHAGQQSMKQFDDAIASAMGVEGKPAARDASSPFAVAANLQRQYWSPIVEFWKSALGNPSAAGSRPPSRDRRFQDEAWQHSPYYQLIKKSYLMTSKQLAELVDQAQVDEKSKLRRRSKITANRRLRLLHMNAALYKEATATGTILSMVNVRALQPYDIDALYAISLATGLAGGDASSLYSDPKLMGHIYAAPYARLQPDLCLVAEDAAGVAGFVVGTADTSAWESRLEREWWPRLRRQYPAPDAARMAEWSHDQRRIFMIHNPKPTPAAVVQSYPSHLHINLLPRLQGSGTGSRMFAAWLSMAASRGIGPMHVGVNRANTRAISFWHRAGFIELDIPEVRAGRTIWMGRQ